MHGSCEADREVHVPDSEEVLAERGHGFGRS
jgi:hypothetical protein